MRPSSLGRALQKALLLRRTIETSVDEARKSLLVNIIETYTRLNGTEEAEFRQVMGREGSPGGAFYSKANPVYWRLYGA